MTCLGAVTPLVLIIPGFNTRGELRYTRSSHIIAAHIVDWR